MALSFKPLALASTLLLAGVAGPVDRNAFFGTRTDWATWLRSHRPSA